MKIKVPGVPDKYQPVAFGALAIGGVWLLSRFTGSSGTADAGAYLQSQQIASSTNVALADISAKRDAAIASSNADLSKTLAEVQGARSIAELQSYSAQALALTDEREREREQQTARLGMWASETSALDTAALNMATSVALARLATGAQVELGQAQINAGREIALAQTASEERINMAQTSVTRESLPYLANIRGQELAVQERLTSRAQYSDYMQNLWAYDTNKRAIKASQPSGVQQAIGGIGALASIASGVVGGPIGAALGLGGIAASGAAVTASSGSGALLGAQAAV